MKLESIISDVSNWFGFLIHSDAPPSQPSSPPPQTNDNQQVDQYSDALRTSLVRSAFGEATANPEQAWVRQSPVFFSPLSLLAIAGCGSEPPTTNNYYNYGGSGGGGQKDAGHSGSGGSGGVSGSSGVGGSGGTGGSNIPVDKDGDGFKSDVDCDDNDPNAYPLKDDQTLNITKNTTICPGTYKRVQINLTNVSGLKIKGFGAILDADGAAIDNQEIANQPIIHFSNAHNNDLGGFEIKNYADRYFGVTLDNSNSNTIHDLNIHDIFEKYGVMAIGPSEGGIYGLNSSNNSIINTTLSGKGAYIFFTGASNYIGSCNIQYSPTGSGGLWTGAIIFENTNGVAENNIINGSGVFSTHAVTVKGNTITNASVGIEIYGDGSKISGNKIHNCGIGIDIYSDNNYFSSNDLTSNGQCYKIESGATGNTVSSDQCN